MELKRVKLFKNLKGLMEYGVKKVMIIGVFMIVLLVILGSFIVNYYNLKPATNYVYEQSEDVLINPYIGFAPFADGGPYAQPHSMVYANLTWKELEPKKGVYDFETIEQKYKLDYWKEKNIKLVFRVVLDYPGKPVHKDIPNWLYHEINKEGIWYDHEWGAGFSPNYNNRKLIKYHEKLIQALAKRYNDDPNIAFIELGSIGHWGEWHTLQQDGIHIPFPRLPVVETYVNHYLKYFPNKFLLMRRPHQIAVDNGMGLYDDMFGNIHETTGEFMSWVNNGYKFWLTDEWNPPMPNSWKYAPIGGEFAPTQEWGDYFSSSNFEETILQLNQTHVSFLGPSSPVYSHSNETIQEHINQFLNQIGYRFHIMEAAFPQTVKSGTKFNLKMLWKNSGVAPFYFQWPVEVSLVAEDDEIVYKQNLDVDIRNWLPGTYSIKEKINIPEKVSAGKYKVNIAILNPESMDPGIQIATDLRRTKGRYEIGEINIK